MAILGDLTARPAMTTAELGATVVTRYAESYRRGGQLATQSAIDLGQLGDLVEAVDILAHRPLDDLKRRSSSRGNLTARVRMLQFFDGLYLGPAPPGGELGQDRGLKADRRRLHHDPVCDRRAEGLEPDHRLSLRLQDGARPRALDLLPDASRPDGALPHLEFEKRARWADFLEAYSEQDRR